MKKNLLENVQNSNLPGVYKITRISDGKVYIGQTSTSIKQRLEQHINNVRVDEESDSIDSAIKKEGAEKFKYETIIALPDAQTEQLWFLEALYIEQYDSYNNGFNKTKGNHKGAYDALDLRNKHKVPLALCKKIEKTFKLDFEDKKVLLIGNFDRRLVDYIEYQKSKVVAIDAYETDEFMEKFNEVMESMENKEFDIILSNPPYGKIGVEVTWRVISEIEFEEFVNLLPANDYFKSGNSKKYKLWQYVKNVKKMIPSRCEFNDAAVTTHIAKIQKVPNLFISAEEFEIENFIDPSLNKFFYENKNRKYKAFDDASSGGFGYRSTDFWDVNTTVIFGKRDVNHKHMPYTKDCDTYKWNVEKSLDYTYIKNKKVDKNGQYTVSNIVFENSTERDNFTKFIYSDDGFRFTSKIFTAVNVDSSIHFSKILPKVDWSKEWTVEKILKDYGYTDNEIQEVMDDLKNFKGMNE